MNQIYETETFTKLYDAAEKTEQTWIDKILKFSTGVSEATPVVRRFR